MRRTFARSATPLALALLFLSCFQSVLFRGEQFSYRDAGSYYYPLHARTSAQWGAGHLPLWDPDENGGLPLIGNPTAAVLYPGKSIFAALPYPWAARLYLIGHVALAFAAMVACLRGLGISRAGSTLGGMSYGFGGPVLLQYCNAIYLVGAAWLPLGVLAADAWIRRGRSRALAGLAFVLAMQVLGGDVQAAYVLGLFAASYAAWMAAGDRVHLPSPRALAIAAATWLLATPIVAAWLPSFRDWAIPAAATLWLARLGRVAILLGVLGLVVRAAKGRGARLARLWGGLLLAALVGAAASGAQLLPVAELSSLSFRMADDPHMDPYGFSLEPYRALEFLWPGVFGIEYPENRLWLLAVPPIDSHAAWVSTLYLGALPILLAIASLSGKGGPAWRAPMAATVAVGLLLSLGRLGSPLWWARCLPELQPLLGGHGVNGSSLFRAEDGLVRDAFGSPYGMLASIAPGLGSFRFPSKQLVFVALGVSALAGLGWDRLAEGASRPPRRTVRAVLAASFVAAVASFVFGGLIVDWLTRSAKVPSIAGPIDAVPALWEFRRSLAHASLAVGLSALVVLAASRGRRWPYPAAVMLLAIDLAVANSRYIWTVPQVEFERPSHAAVAIEESEGKSPGGGPFRVHRMPEWHPLRWIRTRSPDRLREITAWQRDTLQSGHGMLHGVSYTLTPGVIEPEVFLDLFDPWTLAPEPSGARLLDLKPGQQICYFPRRTFDLWGARYFLLPMSPYNWLEPNRAIAAFLPNTEVVAPDPAGFPSNEARERWREDRDWQVLRNPSAFPRAWIVHDVKFRPGPIATASPDYQARKRLLQYQADPFWTIPGRSVEDPRRTAWVEAAAPPPGVSFDGADPSESETVAVADEAPGRVVLDARLDRDGLVVLAAQFYPGWSLTIDGAAAPILRTDLAMCGAAVPAGRHRLVFSYEPASFRIGLIVSAAGLIGMALLAFAPRRDREVPASWEP